MPCPYPFSIQPFIRRAPFAVVATEAESPSGRRRISLQNLFVALGGAALFLDGGLRGGQAGHREALR
jgi:hypothetical protein